jgi:hypothetical protein
MESGIPALPYARATGVGVFVVRCGAVTFDEAGFDELVRTTRLDLLIHVPSRLTLKGARLTIPVPQPPKPHPKPVPTPEPVPSPLPSPDPPPTNPIPQV